MSPKLKNISAYPTYVRVSLSGEYDSILYTLLIKILGWDKIGLLYGDNEYVRTSLSGEFDAILLPLFIRMIGWSKIGILYSDNAYCRSVGMLLANFAKE